MTRFTLRRAAVSATCLLASALVGCSSGGGGLLSGPQYRLLPTAKEFREISPAPAAPRELAKSLLPTYIVEPGDVLLVQPSELDTPVRVTADQPVLPDGTIDLGQAFGRPVVAGKTVPQIEAELQALFRARSKDPVTINVRLINRASKVYYVLGSVNAPGAFPIQGRETALDAILTAGGLTNKASTKTIILSRPTPPCGCRVVFPICYDNIVQLGDTTTNYQLMPGDRIYVPSQTLLESIFPNGGPCKSKKPCGPCDNPQTPCPLDRPGCAGAAGCEGGACALPPVGTVSGPVPGVGLPPRGAVVVDDARR